MRRWPTCRWRFRPSRCGKASSASPLEFPQLPLQPLCADFSKPLRLPIPPRAPRRTVLYFPGSTIGNFESREAAVLLRKMRNEMGDAGGILIGVDLKKDPAVIEAAYNDRAGVTAEFTLNMLARLNREIGSNFELSAFAHRARYNPMAGRIETHIVSRREQQVRIGRGSVSVPRGRGDPGRIQLQVFAGGFRRAGCQGRLGGGSACGPIRSRCSACSTWCAPARWRG